jgi:hypothetical protein
MNEADKGMKQVNAPERRYRRAIKGQHGKPRNGAQKMRVTCQLHGLGA